MKPIIGIVGRPNFPDEKESIIAVKEPIRKTIIEYGGIPFLILPPKLIDYNNSKPSENSELNEEEQDILLKQLEMCDGIIMPGGYKVFSHDFYVLEYAIKNDIPILGICIGMQVMSNYKQEYYNEKIDSDKNSHFDISGEYVHYVNIDKNSKLYSIIGNDRINVNSIHHFCATKGGIYNIVARSDDNIIEALEYPDNRFNMGVQWHPEILDDDASKMLLKTFIKSCNK